MSGVNLSLQRDSCGVIVDSPIPGVPSLAIYIEESGLSSIKFSRQLDTAPCQITPAAAEAAAMLTAYFNDAHSKAPLLRPPHGTLFQHRVWHTLQQIPPGETRQYGELAEQLGSSARAVANACRANPLPILIPCHRVVSASGLGGYMGEADGPALEIKRWLLHHEGHV